MTSRWSLTLAIALVDTHPGGEHVGKAVDRVHPQAGADVGRTHIRVDEQYPVLCLRESQGKAGGNHGAALLRAGGADEKALAVVPGGVLDRGTQNPHRFRHPFSRTLIQRLFRRGKNAQQHGVPGGAVFFIIPDEVVLYLKIEKEAQVKEHS